MRLILVPYLTALAAAFLSDELLSDRAERPTVGRRNNDWYCTKAVDRLKSQNPSDIDGFLNNKTQYVDTSFYREDTIRWEGFNDEEEYWDWYGYYLWAGYYYFDRWRTRVPEVGLFDADGTVDWTEVIQDGAGTCYLKAAAGSLAEFPDLVKALFVNPERNDEGIYGVRFYIRGKPWVVTVDDTMLFGWGGSPRLVFGQMSADRKSIWGAVLEKAWAKVRGNYMQADAGGIVTNGLRALTGVPVFSYWAGGMDEPSEVDAFFERVSAAEAADYIMGASTSGVYDDSYSNSCGVATLHAYSIISAFTMTDQAGKEHRCLLMRNPWGSHGYSWTWSAEDPNWTRDLIAQVPHGVDPTSRAAKSTGLFVVPVEAFQGGRCFEWYDIGHNRESEGYVDVWYDQINADGSNYFYEYVPNESEMPIYFTVETYSYNIIPISCTTNDFWGGRQPWVQFSVERRGRTIGEKYYYDAYHRPIVAEYDRADSPYDIKVNYDWEGSPYRDFTVKVYAQMLDDVVGSLTDVDGNTNMLYTDGRQPSEFDYAKTIDPYIPASWQMDPADVRVTSLFDAYTKSRDFAHFLALVRHNSWTLMVWF